MSCTEETVAAIRELGKRIETVALHYEQSNSRDSINETIKFLLTEAQDSNLIEEVAKKTVNSIKTIVTEKKIETEKQNTLIKDNISKMDKLNEEKLTLQAQIKAIEDCLPQDATKPIEDSKEKLQEKLDCALAWKILTNTDLDCLNATASGYHFNKNCLRYKTFEFDLRNPRSTEELWTLISENNKIIDK